MFAFFRKLSRRDLFETPFPEEYKKLVARNVPLYEKLSAEERQKLEGLIRILLAEKNFVGAGGLELTEEMCLAIAARACLLVLRRVSLDDPLYPELGSVVVYPSGYQAPVQRREGYVVHELKEHRLGESWQHGTLVLSWKAAKQGAAMPHDGHDVVIHEFAHQLDGEQGMMNGTPELDGGDSYARWAEIFSEEFHALREDLSEHRRTEIDAYGATNPAEFFAVVTEQFFERPAPMKKHHAELYRELVGYYRLDPLALLQ
jgi:Mlc titration factor MtfA (ptsG expression regulator)